jgi:hypothetical protein
MLLLLFLLPLRQYLGVPTVGNDATAATLAVVYGLPTPAAATGTRGREMIILFSAQISPRPYPTLASEHEQGAFCSLHRKGWTHEWWMYFNMYLHVLRWSVEEAATLIIRSIIYV